MKDSLNRLISLLPHIDTDNGRDLVKYFLYFITVENNQSSATASDIRNCFQELHMTPYTRISQFLSEGSSRKYMKKPIFVRVGKSGYRLERSEEQRIKELVKTEPIKVHTSKTLRELLDNLTLERERQFLEETIRCYEVDAYRAAIVMGWILTLDHLYEYIINHKLTDFNYAMSKNQGIKLSKVNNKDDFSSLKESVFIDVCRSANIISNDVRKILDQKLDIRNSAAHPSNIAIAKLKATEFLEDLVTNVIVKYPI